MKTDVAALSLLLALLIPGDEAGGQPVAGLLHHSIEFYPLDLSLPVLEVVWTFIAQEKTKKVAMYHKDQFTPYDAQFTDRLQLSNYGTKLRINDLRMEDTGVYTAEVTFTNNEMGHESYVLTVYVPIIISNISMTITGETSSLTVFFTGDKPRSVIWSKIGGKLPEGYLLTDQGKTLTIPGAVTGVYRVVVRNAASEDSQEYSVPGKDRGHYKIIGPAFLVLVLIVIVLLIWIRKRAKNMKRRRKREGMT